MIIYKKAAPKQQAHSKQADVGNHCPLADVQRPPLTRTQRWGFNVPVCQGDAPLIHLGVNGPFRERNPSGRIETDDDAIER